jgi:hypothetical protein
MNQDKVSAATAGVGSAGHIGGIYLQKITGTRFPFIPYREDQVSNSLPRAAGWPLLVRAQPHTKPTIGWLDSRPGLPPRESVEEFRRGLAEVGFSEGHDVTIEYYPTVGHPERLSALAVDPPQAEAIFASTGLSALVAKATTRDINASAITFIKLMFYVVPQ